MTRFVPYQQRHGAAPVEGDERRESDATYTLDRQVSRARREMGEAEWQRLNKEWL